MTRLKKQNVLSTFFATEWAMEPEYLRWMTSLVLDLCALSTEERGSRLRAVEAERGELLDYTWNTRIRDGVAIIPISGPIAPGMDAFTYYSGGTSVARLAIDFNAVLNDPRVDAILFKVNSPGGAVDDVSPMARMIFEARGRKPMTVHVGGKCCSAAYWLAAAAGDIVGDDTSRNGSIGVYTAYLDSSKHDAKNGFREVVFRSAQSPKKNLNPTTPAGADEMQMTLDALGQVFVEAVAEFRGVELEKVLADFGQGGVRVGQAAVEAGLIDRVAGFEETLADLSRHGRGKQGGFNGAVVNGTVMNASDAEAADEGEGCRQHADGDCPEDCPNFVPVEDEEEGAQNSARERQSPPAAPAIPSEGANSMTANNDGQAPGPGAGATGADAAQTVRTDAAQNPSAADAGLLARLEAVERENKRLTAEARDKRLDALVAGFQGEGETHLLVLKHLAETAGEESEVFAGYVAQQKALAEQVRTGKLYAQFGADGFPEGDVNTPGGADAKLTARAKAIAKEEGVTFEKAYVKACSENPDLAAVANTTVANNE